ncbi:MAG: helicase [Bacteroidaceae bacterium]|nr:helicase [Bacteroidaceae bacterium]
MNNLIHTKRDELETFIREQMIGPNGCCGKFALECNSSDENAGEVLNTTPGSIYSTAVLFPKKSAVTLNDSSLSNSIFVEDNQVSTNGESTDDDITATDTTEQNGAIGSDSDEEDVYSLSRRFPNTVGLSCCVSEGTDLSTDIDITVTGRYYTKVLREQKQKVQVIITSHIEEFENFFNSTPSLQQYFIYSHGKLKIKAIPAKDIAKVPELLRDINMSCAASIAQNADGVTDPRFLSIGQNFRYLLSYREVLFNKYLNHVEKEKGDDDSETTFYLNENEVKEVKERLGKIEMYETFMSYFDDLIGLYDHKSYGFWQAHEISAKIDLSTIDFSVNSGLIKQIYKPSEYKCLDKFFKQEIEGGLQVALSAWVQVTKNSKDINDKNLYLKILLVNDSDPFIETPRDYFSIVNENVNKLSFFGIKLDVASKQIIPYHSQSNYNDIFNDDHNLNFLYREIKDYGVGHLCSVDWPKTGIVDHVWTEFIPTYETPDIEPEPRKKFAEFIQKGETKIPEPYLHDTSCLQFKWLSTYSDTSDADIIKGLISFVQLYKNWITTTASKIAKQSDVKFALHNLEKCNQDMERMMLNIRNILSDSRNMHSFRLMNSAMFMQLWHNKKENQKIVLEDDPDIDPSFYEEASDFIFAEGVHAAWRPFQLAFILLNLDGIVRNTNDSNWDKRNELVDLVWFPTGGGKTEAYLGLIALCIIHRRRTYKDKGNGVAAIMRYTLRLLTTQQFQRAMRLILALEQMRRWNQNGYELGNQEISIGLFVGANSLPNKLTGDKSLEEEALKWNNREAGENKTRIPLDRCPWCGSKLKYSSREKKFICSNPNDTCTFEDGFPVRLCDESIYKEPPTLLFGTVDKFAAIAHKVSTKPTEREKDSRRIFGQIINCLPPDLIIQDELHLLLGPLGSAVSLFECAIDKLCTRVEKINGQLIKVRPKIISSTATTRNTELQIRALYDRNVNIFPHNGTDYDDSFFAFYRREEKDHAVSFISKRKYMGIMPTGRTQMTTQMRLAAIILVHRAIFERDHINESGFEYAVDNYYSTISYFNSLKEVGKTDAQFFTEYSKYVRRLFKRVMRNGNLLECFYAMGDLKESELSGRLSGQEVNEKFAEVGQNWTLETRLPHKQKDVWTRGTTPPDYILATNMISVGLDVSRFNTIIMNSMPRNIAEYIQASSRVARKEEGLVITLHNPFRSRDVSHFEKFREFHEKLYYYVEPISITPFSQKSVEKYLPLYLAAIVRHTFIELADRTGAKKIIDDNNKQEIRNIVIDYFTQRYERTRKLETIEKGLLTEELKEYIIKYVDQALEQWVDVARSTEDLVYSKNLFKKSELALFTTPSDYEDTKNKSFWTVPQSLRIVEPEAVLKISVTNYGN